LYISASHLSIPAAYPSKTVTDAVCATESHGWIF